MIYDAQDILAELARRQRLRRKIDIKALVTENSFEKQLGYIMDQDSRFRSMKCTRRAGKSNADVLENFIIAMTYPKSRLVYGALTLDSAVDIAWEIYLDFADKFKIDIKTKGGKKIIFPNGSSIRFFGLDSSVREMRKILGQKLRKCSIDEAGSMTIDMKKVCFQMVMPALSDLRPYSWLTLLGTCENIPNTFFESVTEGKETTVPWSRHEWTAYDNPYMKRQWTEEIEDLKKANPRVVEASWFRTHYLNQWCTDEELQIIVYDEENKREELPDNKKWNYILGVDLGFNDATSFTVVAFSFDDPNVYFVESFKDTEMDFTDTANQIKELQRRYDFLHYIVDGANKQGVEEIKKRHQIPLESAEKSDKATYLRLMRDDLITKKALIVDKQCSDLTDEWDSLQWKDEDKKDEDPRCQNHCSDSALYAWRKAYHYTYQPPEPEPDRDSDEFMDELERKEAEEMRRQHEEAQEWMNY